MIRPSETLAGTQLNSVWLEGVLVADPVDGSEAVPACRFRVRIPRAAPPESDAVFLVEATDSALDGCRPTLRRGRAVRVIGRLHQHRWTDPLGRLREEVKIVSELVEPSGASV